MKISSLYKDEAGNPKNLGLISKRIWIIFLLLLPAYIYFLKICTTRTDYEAITVGDINDVSDLVELSGGYSEKGSFNSVYVTTFAHTTEFQNIILESSKMASTSDQSYTTYFSDSELQMMGVIQKNSSIMYSLINAYSKAKLLDPSIILNYQMNGYRISYRSRESDLRVNDFVYQVNDYNVYDNKDKFIEAFNNLKIGDVFYLKRGNDDLEITIKNGDYKYGDDQCGYFMYDIDYESASPKISVNKSSTTGPSAGLLQTLSIWNRLVKNDYTYGLTIAGTGTIKLDGTVGAIGGIRQKIFTSYYNKVDIFFCPKDNYEEALEAYNTLRHKERMKLVCVQNLDDAISYLVSYND